MMDHSMDQDRIRYLTDNYAPAPEELAMLRIEGCSDTSVYRQLLQLRGRRDEEASCCRSIGEECGKTESDIRREISFIRSMDPPVEIDLERYCDMLPPLTLRVEVGASCSMALSGQVSTGYPRLPGGS